MGTIRRLFQVERLEINYLRVTIESYDGMAVVRTIDPHTALIELGISPGCEDVILELLESLRETEGIRIKEVSNRASKTLRN
ncbi:unnamed protein product [marine sediment metagenome]|uniref:DUF4911 domain-containing protein n=1 Tax=marine sediment metagenome TaxID=412755 RepID=X0U774_9ZZZZ